MSNKTFVSQPLDKQMNRDNIIDKIARQGDRTGPKPSATIGNLSELSPDTGEQIINILRVIDQETGAQVLLLNQDGIYILAGANDKNFLKWVDENGATLLKMYETGSPDYIAYIRADNITGGYALLSLNPATNTVSVQNLEILGTKTENNFSGQHLLPFTTYQTLSPMTATNSYPFACTIGRNVTLKSWKQEAYVATTNNGSNYWRITLRKTSDGSQVDQIDTSGMSASTHTVLSDTVFDVASLTASDIGLYFDCTKQGSPGSLYLSGPEIVGAY